MGPTNAEAVVRLRWENTTGRVSYKRQYFRTVYSSRLHQHHHQH